MADDLRERLQRRQEARLSELDRKRQERAEQTRPEENPKLLLSTFVKEKERIEEMLCDLGDLEKSSLRERFDEVSNKTQLLQKFFSDSLAFLPSYDIKELQEQINKLEQCINHKRNSYLPKKKFAFSKKKLADSTTKGEPNITDPKKPDFCTTTKDDAQDVQKVCEDIPANTTTVSDIFTIGQQITKEQTDLQDKHITLSKLKDCTITLYGSPSALHLGKLEHCKVFCGPVSGSIFIDDCKDCTFVLPCQQLRVHTTVRSQFYLLVTSRAIIEDCQELGFADFNWSYEGIDSHFESSRLDHTKNNWQLVSDFNWLRTDKQSPNWYLIKDKDKVKTWN